MLSCKELVGRSSDLLDKQLNLREQVAVRFHLLICPNCRRFIQQLRLTQEVIRMMPIEPAIDAQQLAEHLMQAQREQP